VISPPTPVEQIRKRLESYRALSAQSILSARLDCRIDELEWVLELLEEEADERVEDGAD
jgi:hypothetical protein